MASIFKSKLARETAKPFEEPAKRLVLLFPDLEWDLKRAGYTIDTTQFLSVVMYLALMTLIGCMFIIVLPLVLVKGKDQFYIALLFSIFITFIMFLYLLFVPKLEISKRGRLIDRDLEYMLKDMEIQLSSGVPLFDTLVNVGKGKYGECSVIADEIVQEVEAGKSMTDVLDGVGLWSPSDYLRNVLWQIVNTVRSGSDIKRALAAISSDLRIDKENKIKSYAQELNMWGLMYMLGAIILPSMGVTLLVILSSFIGGGVITETLFWLILLGLIIFQVVFISFVKGKRPAI
ncbi:MAG: type II secretion system F family protein [Candidatus Altiarchaeota archaeon]